MTGAHKWPVAPSLSAIGLIEQFFGMDEQNPGQGQRDYGDVASGFSMEGTMRAPIPTPEGLPAQAAMIIMGCLFVFLSALWLFVITKTMIAIGAGVVALVIAGICAFAHRHALNAEPQQDRLRRPILVSDATSRSRRGISRLHKLALWTYTFALRSWRVRSVRTDQDWGTGCPRSSSIDGKSARGFSLGSLVEY